MVVTLDLATASHTSALPSLSRLNTRFPSMLTARSTTSAAVWSVKWATSSPEEASQTLTTCWAVARNAPFGENARAVADLLSLDRRGPGSPVVTLHSATAPSSKQPRLACHGDRRSGTWHARCRRGVACCNRSHKHPAELVSAGDKRVSSRRSATC